MSISASHLFGGASRDNNLTAVGGWSLLRDEQTGEVYAAETVAEEPLLGLGRPGETVSRMSARDDYLEFFPRSLRPWAATILGRLPAAVDALECACELVDLESVFDSISCRLIGDALCFCPAEAVGRGNMAEFLRSAGGVRRLNESWYLAYRPDLVRGEDVRASFVVEPPAVEMAVHEPVADVGVETDEAEPVVRGDRDAVAGSAFDTPDSVSVGPDVPGYCWLALFERGEWERVAHDLGAFPTLAAVVAAGANLNAHACEVADGYWHVQTRWMSERNGKPLRDIPLRDRLGAGHVGGACAVSAGGEGICASCWRGDPMVDIGAGVQKMDVALKMRDDNMPDAPHFVVSNRVYRRSPAESVVVVNNMSMSVQEGGIDTYLMPWVKRPDKRDTLFADLEYWYAYLEPGTLYWFDRHAVIPSGPVCLCVRGALSLTRARWPGLSSALRVECIEKNGWLKYVEGVTCYLEDRHHALHMGTIWYYPWVGARSVDGSYVASGSQVDVRGGLNMHFEHKPRDVQLEVYNGSYRIGEMWVCGGATLHVYLKPEMGLEAVPLEPGSAATADVYHPPAFLPCFQVSRTNSQGRPASLRDKRRASTGSNEAVLTSTSQSAAESGTMTSIEGNRSVRAASGSVMSGTARLFRFGAE